MSTVLERRAETAKLARLLGAEPERLAFLEPLAIEDLRALRERITETLFATGAGRLHRLAAASRLLPAALVATIGQRAFGPLLCARIAGLLEPARAVDVARRLSSDFLADVAVEMDPRRARDVLVHMPADKVAEVGGELARRGETITMGRFVAHLSDEALAATLAVIDDAALLQVTFMLEDKDRLDHLLELVGEERLGRVIRVAATSGLWPEALDVLDHAGPERRALLVRLAARQADSVLDAMVGAARDADLWDVVLPLVALMDQGERERFAALAAVHEPAVLDGVLAATARHGLWAELLPLVPLLPAEAQAHVARAAGQEGST